MLYLFIQTWIWILAAGLFGLFIGWLIWGRSVHRKITSDKGSEQAPLQGRSDSNVDKPTIPDDIKDDIPVKEIVPNEVTDLYREAPSTDTLFDDDVKVDERPPDLSGPHGEPDDLKRIKGVGPVIERKLNEIGIFHFHQIAAFSDENIRWIDNNLAFPGRVNREQWVGQAKLLEMGVSTEFSDRYDSK